MSRPSGNLLNSNIGVVAFTSLDIDIQTFMQEELFRDLDPKIAL
jgi:hypothetical protein